MIGIIAAMQEEMELISERMETPTDETAGGISFRRGNIGGREVVCAVCGIGKVFSSMCAEAMIIKYSPSIIINTGVGGSLTEKLSIGDIAVSSSVCQHDMDTTAFGDEPGLVPGIEKVYFDADEDAADELEKIAARMNIHTVRGTIASGDCFVADAAVKERIVSNFGAVACEMEGGAIGHVCAVCGVPFVVIRAVSDDASGEATEDYPAFVSQSAKRSAAIVCEYVRNAKLERK